MAYISSIESLESKLQKAADQLGSAIGEPERNTILGQVQGLLNEVKTSVEDRAKLSAQIERVSTEVNKLTGTNEKAKEIKLVIDGVRQSLAALGATVEAGRDEKKQNWFSRLFGGGFSYDGITTSIAFSMGDVLKQAKESGFNFSKMLLPFMSMVGLDKIEVASALRAQGFEGIDMTKGGKFGAVLAVRKAKFPSMPIEQFAAELAIKTKNTFPGQTTISYKQLADVAEVWGAAAAQAAVVGGAAPVRPTEVGAAIALPPLTFDQLKAGADIGLYKGLKVSETGMEIDGKQWNLLAKEAPATTKGPLKVNEAAIDSTTFRLTISGIKLTLPYEKVMQMLAHLTVSSAQFALGEGVYLERKTTV